MANKVPRIEMVCCAFSFEDGSEGLVGELLPNGTWVPYISADPARRAWIEARAEDLARQRKMRVVVAQFTVRTDLKVFDFK